MILFVLVTRQGVISVTMYNFGSPRVGNKRFADVYNEVKDNTYNIDIRNDDSFVALNGIVSNELKDFEI